MENIPEGSVKDQEIINKLGCQSKRRKNQKMPETRKLLDFTAK